EEDQMRPPGEHRSRGGRGPGRLPVGGDRRQPGQTLAQIGKPGQGPFGRGALNDEVAGESSLVTGRTPGPLLIGTRRIEAVRRPLQPLPALPWGGRGPTQPGGYDTSAP